MKDKPKLPDDEDFFLEMSWFDVVVMLALAAVVAAWERVRR